LGKNERLYVAMFLGKRWLETCQEFEPGIKSPHFGTFCCKQLHVETLQVAFSKIHRDPNRQDSMPHDVVCVAVPDASR